MEGVIPASTAELTSAEKFSRPERLPSASAKASAPHLSPLSSKSERAISGYSEPNPPISESAMTHSGSAQEILPAADLMKETSSGSGSANDAARTRIENNAMN
ncbi:Uncharacterised protein [uncultured archaeon]|nr:Uncharacterised protein [uncultured archaeon]